MQTRSETSAWLQYFLSVWKVTFECVWDLDVKYVFTAVPKPSWRAPKCFEPLINDKLPLSPHHPHLLLSLLPRKSNLLLVIRCNQLCFMAFKKSLKKSKNKQKGGKKNLRERGTSLLIKPHAPKFWWSCAGTANIQHLFFDYQWLTYCSVPQTLIKSHSAHEDPP